MKKSITGIRLRKDRAEKLREKAIDLTIKKKDYVKESDIVNYLIDAFVDRIDIDNEGLFVKEEDLN